MVSGEQTRIRLAWPDVGQEELDAVAAVIESGMLTMGSLVGELECELAKACETKDAIAVSSGAAALHLAVALDDRVHVAGLVGIDHGGLELGHLGGQRTHRPDAVHPTVTGDKISARVTD